MPIKVIVLPAGGLGGLGRLGGLGGYGDDAYGDDAYGMMPEMPEPIDAWDKAPWPPKLHSKCDPKEDLQVNAVASKMLCSENKHGHWKWSPVV